MAGFIYIMSNPAYKSVKIGKSDRDPNEYRKSELDGTGVPFPFKVEYSALVENHHRLEKMLHRMFRHARPNKQREFFDVSIEEVIKNIEKLGGVIQTLVSYKAPDEQTPTLKYRYNVHGRILVTERIGCQWAAYYEENREFWHSRGWGATEQEAFDNMLEHSSEKAQAGRSMTSKEVKIAQTGLQDWDSYNWDSHTKHVSWTCVKCSTPFSVTVVRGESHTRCPKCLSLSRV